jgi:signal transduction histidine kinase
LELPATIRPVSADPDRLEQVLDNLLNNAVKYSPQGGDVRVILGEDHAEQTGHASTGENRGVRLTVQDQGIGLPPGMEEIIFEPFGRASNATQNHLPGMGLGLYISRHIVEQHGGRIWVESPGEGQGTRFHVWLPFEPPPATVASASRPAHERTAVGDRVSTGGSGADV